MKRCKEKILLESRLKSDFPQNFFTEVTAALYPLCFDPEREAVKDLLIDIIHKKNVKKTLFKAIFFIGLLTLCSLYLPIINGPYFAGYLWLMMVCNDPIQFSKN